MNHARRLDRRVALRKTRRLAIKDQVRRGLLAERLEDRSLMAADAITSFFASSSWWNATKPTDVNADGMVTASDAMAVINNLNANGAHALTANGPEGEALKPMFVDTNNDGRVTAADALNVINMLNAEGEFPDTLAKYTVKIVDAPLGGATTPNEITSIRQGQDFYVELIGQDQRPNGTYQDGTPLLRGLSEAFASILYNKSFVSVAVGEVQTLTFGAGAPTTGSMTLTLNAGQTTAPFNFDNTGAAGRGNTVTNMQTALNNLLGAGAVTVKNTTGNNYRITFVGAPFLNVDEPNLQPSIPNVTVAETLKGDPTVTASFATAAAFNNNILVTDSGGNPHTYAYDALLHPNTNDSGDLADRVVALGGTNFTASLQGVGFTTDPIPVATLHMIAKPLPAGVNSQQTVFTPDASVENDPNGPYTTTFQTLEMANQSGTLHGTSPDTNQDGTVTAAQIQYAAATLNIVVGNVIPAPDPATIDEDTAAGVTIPVLANDTTVPAGQALEIKSFTQPASGGTVTQVGNQLKFVPSANFSGTATFTYVAGIVGSTNANDTGVGTVTVTVNPINDAPTINAIAPVNINEDQNTVVNLSGISPGGGADEANQTVTITATSDNPGLIANPVPVTYTNGNATGSIAINPIADASGTAHITVNVSDGTLTTPVTFTVTVNPVNDAPVNQIGTPPAPIVSGASVVVIPDTPFAFTGDSALSVKDVDAGPSFSVTLAVTPANSGTLNANGATGNGTANLTISGTLAQVNAALATLVYTPPPSVASGTATLTMTSNDTQLQDSDQIEIDIVPPNKPFARNFTGAVFDEGTTAAQTIDVLSKVLTNAGATATLSACSTPLNGGPGTVTLNNNGTPTDATDDKCVYTPPGGDFNGTVRFTYTADETPNTNSHGPTTGTVSIVINPVNDQPVAQDDSYSTAIGVPLVVTAQGTPKGVLNNDTDVDVGDTLTAINAQIAAGQGSVNLLPDGGFTYTPPAGGGDFTFTYQARDSSGASNNTSAPATVHIHVAAPPQANPDTYTDAQEDTPYHGTSVLANDSDPTEHQPLTAVLDTNVPAATGSVTLNADGTFTYNPAQDFNTTRPPTAPITFTYHASAGGRNSAPTTVSITVNEVNDNPTAVNDTFLAVKHNGSIGVDQLINVLANDSIAPDTGETLTVVGVATTAAGPFSAGPTATTAGGSVKVSGGQVFYTSPTTTGADSFFYQISDGRGGLASARVDVTVVDFVPKTVSGTVYVDANNNGLVDAAETTDVNGNGVLDLAEKRLAGVEVHLTGTDFLNQPVSLVAVTDVNGNYSFPAAGSSFILKPPAPGTVYTLTEIQPVYLLSGLDTNTTNNALVTNASRTDNAFTMSWAVTDQTGNITGLNFGEGGINAAALSNSSGLIQEFFATSGQNGFVIAADLSGNTLWSWSLPGWDGASNVSATLDPSFAFLTLHVTINGTNYDMRLTQGYIRGADGSILSTARFRVLGVGQNGQYIIRIDGSFNGATDGMQQFMQVATNAPAAGGEGEAPVDSNYSHSADAVFAGQAWA